MFGFWTTIAAAPISALVLQSSPLQLRLIAVRSDISWTPKLNISIYPARQTYSLMSGWPSGWPSGCEAKDATPPQPSSTPLHPKTVSSGRLPGSYAFVERVDDEETWSGQAIYSAHPKGRAGPRGGHVQHHHETSDNGDQHGHVRCV